MFGGFGQQQQGNNIFGGFGQQQGQHAHPVRPQLAAQRGRAAEGPVLHPAEP